MSEIPIEKKFEVLSEITRAQHFAWREAVCRLCPDVDATEVVLGMWQVTGEQTAKAYAKRMDPNQPLAAQLAKHIVWSSQSMGEDAHVEDGAHREESYVRHRACPWHGWHERLGLSAEDRPGCDRWFQATVDALNQTLGTRIRFETLESLPEGGSSCLRRFWVEHDETP